MTPRSLFSKAERTTLESNTICHFRANHRIAELVFQFAIEVYWHVVIS